MKKLLIISIIALMAALVGCSSGENTTNQGANQTATEAQTNDGAATYEEVDIAKAKELIEQGVKIVDVRTAEEYAEGHIPGAVLIPLEEIEGRLSEFNQDETYLMVCRSGNRSGQASEILVKNGVANAVNMLGGMKEWDGEVVTE
ncbi:rhodanese-like domain-containing protein [Calidifontibacillus oryziterrae]|uniref:rhodanese-like domain-containing protein n=1 Tax=Calidifontibacillus oryziterrae TaxID=1191699 RepID=UPI0002FA5913|nr:rhodanese-like domain-containing protein [Calidifontibacillus oryziterrae]